MNIRRKCFALILALLLLLSVAGTVAADENEEVTDYARQIVNYYRYYQEDAKTDIDCLIYAMSEIDLEQAQAWASIMEYWTYANTDMTIYPEVLPDGLPQTDALCIVVLGYQLNGNGSMRGELICRLEAALASAEKYPNAFIVCTGGGTAKNNKSLTEAGQMTKWLMEKGISEERIIVEDQSLSTTGNARNTCSILTERYPQVTHLAIVTSDYHLPRACLLFHAKANLLAVNDGTPLMCVAANAAYETNVSQSDFDLQLDNLLAIAGIKLDGMKKPLLSKLDCILASGSSQCFSGEALNLQVMAYYDTGLYQDVTKHVTYSGLDHTTAGMQEITITYAEGDVEVSTTAQIEMILPPTEPPTDPPTEPPTEAPTEAPTEPPVTEPDSGSLIAVLAENWLIVAAITVCLLVLAEVWIIVRLRKIKKRQKAIKAAKEAAKLPDDDSPLEYI